MAKKKVKKYKRKTHRGAAKRFKVTSGGKILRGHSGKRHLMGTKKPSRMRRLRKMGLVHKTDALNVKHLLPYA
jgi:large subunit ribosomal protein L35